jgi:3-oxoacyl-[acyl-carrier-protein] synthase III
MFVSAPHLRIAGTGSFVPERVVTNEELERTSPTKAAWVKENLGILERRVVNPDGEFSSDLAYQAALKALESAKLEPNDIDLIIVATATPDRKAPSTACILQDKLGITNNSPAFDIAAVCSGFVYAMSLAAQSVESGASKNVLVVGVDTFSKITDWDRRDCVFFGDGAGAVVLSRSEKAGKFSAVLKADGAGKDHFTVFPYDKHFTMNGKAVYETGTEVLPAAIREVLAKNNLTTKDVTHIIPHQPSIRVLTKTAELLEVPVDTVKMNMQSYANTAGATVGLLLDEVHRSGDIKTGDIVVFAAVGSGWTWGAAVYQWQ